MEGLGRISKKEASLNFRQSINCPQCASATGLKIFYSYYQLSLPILKLIGWKKEYYVLLDCCRSKYRLDPEVARDLRRSLVDELRPEDLEYIGQEDLKCRICSYPLERDFSYCPRCGGRIDENKKV